MEVLNRVKVLNKKFLYTFTDEKKAASRLITKENHHGIIEMKCREDSLCATCINYDFRVIFDEESTSKRFFLLFDRRKVGNYAFDIVRGILKREGFLDGNIDGSNLVNSLGVDKGIGEKILQEFFNKTKLSMTDVKLIPFLVNSGMNVLQETCTKQFSDDGNKLKSYVIEAGGVDICPQYVVNEQ